ncbi:hypothetical protein AVEN_205339-1 [Araneus ventricosus]|uniref:Transposase Tc1-like domain-containing protein n=1 Tax=Araneus ventricosus TaxID=182803 RepID=A0A4Y2LSB1_ARAVE|nr:hypothetical protein AVEN_205339-1 [Araneus ventricosus]
MVRKKNWRSGKLQRTISLERAWLRRLTRIVSSQRSQTLAQITTQLNQGTSRTVSKRTVQRSLHRMGFGSRRPTRVPLLNAAIGLHVLRGRVNTENGL